MTTNNQIKTTATYTPDTRTLTFLDDKGNPVSGMVGWIAEQKHQVLRRDLDKHIHALLAVKGLQDIKQDILTKYGVAHVSELTIEQMQQLYAELQQCDVCEPVRKARSMVLSLLSDGFNIRCENGNWDRVNAFLRSPRIAGKPLYDLTAEELRRCAIRLRMIMRKSAATELPF
jgi:hypothetical protein